MKNGSRQILDLILKCDQDFISRGVMARAAGKGLLVLLGGAALLVLVALAGIQSRRQVGLRPRSILAF